MEYGGEFEIEKTYFIRWDFLDIAVFVDDETDRRSDSYSTVRIEVMGMGADTKDFVELVVNTGECGDWGV